MYKRSSQSGFTLIEMIVSLGVFSVVVTIAVGALLVLIAANRQLQQEQSILTNLAFALDSMTREIRTGSQYFCHDANSLISAGDDRIFNDGISPGLDDVLAVGDTQDCPAGRSSSARYQGVAFIEGGESITGAANSRILYYFDEQNGQLYRRVGGGDSESIVSDGIYLVDVEFFVSGSDPLLGGPPSDDHQSTVTISMIAAASDESSEKQYRIQTTITQRTLDI